MTGTEVNTHVNLGLEWKQHREYTTVYLKPRPGCASTSDER